MITFVFGNETHRDAVAWCSGICQFLSCIYVVPWQDEQPQMNLTLLYPCQDKNITNSSTKRYEHDDMVSINNESLMCTS